MKINYRVFVSFAMTLQILILLFGIAAIPVAGTPSMPLVLQGTVVVDGEPAPVNTQIVAKINGDVVGTAEVDQEGVYGSQPGTKLYITCEPDDYGNIVFYVNGVESQLVDVDVLNNAESGAVLESVNMVATSPVDGGTGDDGTSDDSGSSSGGGSYGGGAATTSSGTTTTSDETSSESTASASTTSLKSVADTQSPDDSVEGGAPAAETGSSLMTIFIGAIVLLGIVVIAGYKLKEN